MELDFVALSAVVGVSLPLAISLFKNLYKTWPSQWVRIFAFSAAFVAAGVSVAADQEWVWPLDWNLVLASGGVIYAIAQASFKGLWEGTNIEGALANTMNTNGGA